MFNQKQKQKQRRYKLKLITGQESLKNLILRYVIDAYILLGVSKEPVQT